MASSQEIKIIGIVGAGQMGSGIAQVALGKGLKVILSDVGKEILERAIRGITRGLEKQVIKENLPKENLNKFLSNLEVLEGLEAMKNADFVIEAVTENYDLKAGILSGLNKICSPEVILASNTSSISITLLGKTSSRPGNTIGMHFMNPPPLMKLVEVIKGLETSQDTCEKTSSLAQFLGKTTVVSQDYPGFIVNRILMPMINEAVFALQEGVGSPKDIDKAMKLGCNHPMGPLELADLIGLDTCLYIMEVLHSGIGDPKFRPCPLLKNYVAAGRLGRKSGAGFYTYPS